MSSSSMFYGASNIRISGSPTFTIINGGYHHYDHTTTVQKSTTATVSGNNVLFTNNVFGGKVPTENPNLQRKNARPYPTESNPRQTRGVRTPNPNTHGNALHSRPHQPLSSDSLIEPHPPTQTAPLFLNHSGYQRPYTSVGSPSYHHANFDTSQIQKIDPETSARLTRLMGAVERDAFIAEEDEATESIASHVRGLNNASHDRTWPIEDERAAGPSQWDRLSPPAPSGIEECADMDPDLYPQNEGEDEDLDMVDDSWNHSRDDNNTYDPYRSYEQQPETQQEAQPQPQQNRVPPIPSHVTAILRDLLGPENAVASGGNPRQYR